MELSLFLAKFLGLYMLTIAIIWSVCKQQFEISAQDILFCRGSYALASLFQIILGLLIIISHSVWAKDWRVLITLIGYMAFLQGVFRFVFPEESKKILLRCFTDNAWIWAIVLIILGTTLTYYGFTGLELKQ